MKRIFIVGAGDLGCEIHSWLQDAQYQDGEFYGFLDDNENSAALRQIKDYGVINPISTYTPDERDVLVCAISDPKTKLRICHELKKRGARFIPLIHKTAIIASDCSLGEGVVLFPFTYISTFAQVGAFVNLNVHASVGHNAKLGEGCTISGHCDITGHVEMGTGIFMGTHAAIVPKMKVGDFAVIGAGSTVMHKVQPSTTVIGTPAKCFM